MCGSSMECVEYLAKALLEEIPILLAARRGWREIVGILLPRTSQIDEVTWSVDGLLQHVQSEKFKAMEKKQTETLRIRCIEELKKSNLLASEYILKVLHVGMAHEDFVLLESLHRLLVKCATGSFPLGCIDENIRTYGLGLLEMGHPVGDALQAAQACLALDRDKEANKNFMMEVFRLYAGPSTSSSANC